MKKLQISREVAHRIDEKPGIRGYSVEQMAWLLPPNDKRYLNKLLFILFIVIISSCSSQPVVQDDLGLTLDKPFVAPPFIVELPTQTSTSTPEPSATPTITPTPTKTRNPFRDEYPTVPPTPTSGLPPKATQGPKEVCPPPTYEKTNFHYAKDPLSYEDQIIRFIASKGSSNGLKRQLELLGNKKDRFNNNIPNLVSVQNEDLTEDLNKEYLISISQLDDHIPGFFYTPSRKVIFIIGCRNSNYSTLYKFENKTVFDDDSAYDFLSISDLNKNGVIEVVYSYVGIKDGNWDYISAQVLEWDGSFFQELIPDTAQSRAGARVYFQEEAIQLVDIEKNGTVELLFTQDVPGGYRECDSGPQRTQYEILMWNGGMYRFMWTDQGKPEFIFQAAFDADYYAWLRLYDKSLELYRRAVLDPALTAFTFSKWAEEAMPYCQMSNAWDSKDELILISAYSRFRYLELLAFLGNTSEAQIQMDYLNSQFGEGSPGNPIVKMAEIFWEEYQKGSDISSACSVIEQYANQYKEEIYAPLPFYGNSNHFPEPDMICPFSPGIN